MTIGNSSSWSLFSWEAVLNDIKSSGYITWVCLEYFFVAESEFILRVSIYTIYVVAIKLNF